MLPYEDMAKFSLFLLFVGLTFCVGETWCRSENKWRPFRNQKQRDFARSLPYFRVISPFAATKQGSFLSNDVDKLSSRNELFYVIEAFGEHLLLELALEHRLVASNFASERMLHSQDHLSNISSSCYYTGKVKGMDDSSVAISNCRGLLGIISTANDEYFIEPMAKRRRSHPHLLYRRTALTAQESRDEPLRCGSEHREGTNLPTHRHIWEASHGHVKRSVVSESTVQILVVVDKAMIEFHGKDHIEEYVLTVMNMVAELYRHRSIGMSINIEVVRLVLLHEIPKGLSVTNHGDRTLQSFCDWQSATRWRVSPDSQDYLEYDSAVLLTRKDICADRNSPCGTVGMALLYGMCDRKRRCSVSEDNGLNLAFTVAHELGHNFGLRHDGDGNSCGKNSDSVPHLMSAQWMSGNKHGTLKWSKCSRAGLLSFLRSKESKCLREKSSQPRVKLPRTLPGVFYSADDQCVHQYGNLARLCAKPTFKSRLCRQLWCEIKGEALCRSKRNPPAKGTSCSPGKWCMYGSCVSNTTIPERRDGAWGEWSGWSECSRTCAMGVSTMERKCNNPSSADDKRPTLKGVTLYKTNSILGNVSRPLNGGRFCTGKQKRFRTCNITPCPKGSHDFRKIQCASFNGMRYKGEKHDWRPVYSDKNPCALYCQPVHPKHHFSARLADKVIDGTPCRAGCNDICIDGECHEVGCDHKLGSPAREDICGVCQGNGTSCYVVEGSFNQLAGSGYVQAAMIPKGATSIQVSEVKPCSSFLAVRSDRGTYYINGNWKIQLPGDVIADETVFHYKRKGLWESIIAKGPTTFPIDVMVLYHGFNLGIKYRYALPLNSDPASQGEVSRKFKIDSPTYGWIHGGWGPCSVHCGGGIMRSLKMRCIRVLKGNVSFVEDHLCKDATKSSRDVRVCNEHKCPIWWSLSPWQPCSKTCGMGLQYRQVTCRQELRNGTKTSATESLCPSDKPSGVQICILRACYLQWTTGPWSKDCIALCGVEKGHRRRKVSCPISGMCNPWKKPPSGKPCVNTQPCFHVSEKSSEMYNWAKGDWSKCSVTCGEGIQRRLVKCQHTETGKLTEGCNPGEKPAEVKKCTTRACKRQCVRNAYSHSGCQTVVKLALCGQRRWFNQCCKACLESGPLSLL